MNYYKFEWKRTTEGRNTITHTEHTLTIYAFTEAHAKNKLCDVLNMQLRNLNKWLPSQGYQLSITETEKPKSK